MEVIAGRLFGLLVFVGIFAVLALFFYMATKGRKFSIRKKIAAFDAIPEAVGRATEMGRPMHGTSGGSRTSSYRASHVVAGLTILGYIAELAAKNDVPFHLSPYAADQIVLAEGVMKAAYLKAGHPERFKEEYVHFHGQTDASYQVGILGLVSRENIAASFLIGGFGDESLVFAEAANGIGAFQIAGTPTTFQIPFFVVTCEYVMIGDELFAAACLASGDPIETSFMIGQDVLKIAFIALCIVGTVLSTLGSGLLVSILKT